MSDSALKINKLFVACVVFPTIMAAVYYGFWASDVYVSEARFVVRSPDRQASSSLGFVLQNAGFSQAQGDAYTVHEFMRSRDALTELNRELELHAMFSDSRIDLFSRFNGLGSGGSFEALHRYYLDHVIGIRLDAASSISVLTVSAFDAAEAHRINKRMLELSESFINGLNERGRQDLIRFAKVEVEAAESQVQKAALALSSFRNEQAVVDPEQQAQVQLQNIAKLQDELIEARSQLAQLKLFTKQNPQIPYLVNRIATLERDIEDETTKVTGSEGSLAYQASEYHRLALEREFAASQLASALASLEQARNEALRKQLYLERIVQPNKPDEAAAPNRIRAILVTLLFGIVAWGILALLLAGVREHQR